MIRIPVICLKCRKRGHKWVEASDLEQYPKSELYDAHVHVCATCKHPAKVDPDAPIETVRNDDPERKLHHRRRTGIRAARHVGRG